MNIPPTDELIALFREMALPQILDLLPSIFKLLPTDALLQVAEHVTKEIEAKDEQTAMKAAVAAADAQVDMAEAADIKLAQTGKPY